ncbi:hypothetical protein P1U19_22925 [Escherichia coli]
MRAGLPPVPMLDRDGLRSVKSGGLATGTIINTGAEGGPDSDNSYTGRDEGNSRIHHHQQKWTADSLIFRDSP